MSKNKKKNYLGVREYNYRHFRPSEYDFSRFGGPRPGEKAVDFEAVTLDGETKSLSDYFGGWVVLETGSITCPITESKVAPMNRLARDFSGVTFLVLYTREAHPGEKIREHDSFSEKMSSAKRFQNEYGVRRTVLVDNLEGDAHKKYGSMPNSVYVINPDGRIVFRGDWNDVEAVRKVLKECDPDKIYEKERWSARPHFGGESRGMLGVLRLAGRQAVWDFVKALPKMVIKHISKFW